MPKKHGLYRSIPEGLPSGTRLTAEQAPRFRCGITWVVETLRVGPFLTDPADKIRVTSLKSHFDEITQRFVFSLQHLNDLMQQMAAEFDRSHSMFLPTLLLEAGCQADHVLTYLNSMLDDIARGIVFSTGFVSPCPKRPIDSMGGLKREDIRCRPALAPVSSLLAELDDVNSWWELGFKTGVGARQRLIHNQHVVTFQGSQAPGCEMEVNSYLLTPGPSPTFVKFFAVLRALFAKLCEWLDRLEAALTAHLPVLPPPAWVKNDFYPSILLPVRLPMTGVQLSDQYFPLPLCDGSDPLPWRFAPPTVGADGLSRSAS